jgi:hypothetical protein
MSGYSVVELILAQSQESSAVSTTTAAAAGRSANRATRSAAPRTPRARGLPVLSKTANAAGFVVGDGVAAGRRVDGRDEGPEATLDGTGADGETWTVAVTFPACRPLGLCSAITATTATATPSTASAAPTIRSIRRREGGSGVT